MTKFSSLDRLPAAIVDLQTSRASQLPDTVATASEYSWSTASTLDCIMTMSRGRDSYCTLLVAVVLLGFNGRASALRGFSAKDKAAAQALSSSQNQTSYGQPVIQVEAKPVSVNHFGSVSLFMIMYMSLQNSVHAKLLST